MLSKLRQSADVDRHAPECVATSPNQISQCRFKLLRPSSRIGGKHLFMGYVASDPGYYPLIFVSVAPISVLSTDFGPNALNNVPLQLQVQSKC